MATDSKARRARDQREFTYYVPARWVTYITEAVAAGITTVVVAAITVVVTILVVIGGLWLAYVSLPANLFYILLAVVLADVALGIVLRAVLSRR